MSDNIVCKSCGYCGEPGTATKGSFAIEVLLWLCFLIPGLIYSLWRLSSRHDNCRKCGSLEIIPTDSPLGEKLMRKIAPQSHVVAIPAYRPTTGRKGGLAWTLGRLIGGMRKK